MKNTHAVPPNLVNSATLKTQYGLGRDTAHKLLAHMPHITAGHAGPHPKRIVRRDVLEKFLAQLEAENGDLLDALRLPVTDFRTKYFSERAAA